MSNFERKFNNWREKMNKKTDREKHNFALSISFLLTAFVFFFVISGWYFRISGDNFTTSFFTDIEQIYDKQKQYFIESGKDIQTQKDIFLNTVSGSQTVQATTSIRQENTIKN